VKIGGGALSRGGRLRKRRAAWWWRWQQAEKVKTAWPLAGGRRRATGPRLGRKEEGGPAGLRGCDATWADEGGIFNGNETGRKIEI
jgi:hypothetical protein